MILTFSYNKIVDNSNKNINIIAETVKDALFWKRSASIKTLE